MILFWILTQLAPQLSLSRAIQIHVSLPSSLLIKPSSCQHYAQVSGLWGEIVICSYERCSHETPSVKGVFWCCEPQSGFQPNQHPVFPLSCPPSPAPPGWNLAAHTSGDNATLKAPNTHGSRGQVPSPKSARHEDAFASGSDYRWFCSQVAGHSLQCFSTIF